MVLKGAAPDGRRGQGARQGAARLGGQGDRPDRQAQGDPLRRQPAQDALRQDHAPAAARPSPRARRSRRTSRRSRTRPSWSSSSSRCRPAAPGGRRTGRGRAPSRSRLTGVIPRRPAVEDSSGRRRSESPERPTTMNERQPPPLLTAATADVLRKHAPFDAMREADLAHLAGGPQAALLREGHRRSSRPTSGRIDSLFIIQRGAVQAEEPSQVSLNTLAGTLTDGECFPVGALIARRATTLRYRALRDTFCYVLDEAALQGGDGEEPRVPRLLHAAPGGAARHLHAGARARPTRTAPPTSSPWPRRCATRSATRRSRCRRSASVRQVLELMKIAAHRLDRPHRRGRAPHGDLHPDRRAQPRGARRPAARPPGVRGDDARTRHASGGDAPSRRPRSSWRGAGSATCWS